MSFASMAAELGSVGIDASAADAIASGTAGSLGAYSGIGDTIMGDTGLGGGGAGAGFNISSLLSPGNSLLASLGIGTIGQLAGLLTGQSGVQQAEQQTLGSEVAGLGALGGAQTNALAAISPYTQGGLANYDILNYLLSGQTPTAPTVPVGLYSQIGAITGGAAPTDPTSALNLINTWMAEYPGWQQSHPSHNYSGDLSEAQSIESQLQQYQNQLQAYQGAQQAIGSLPNNLGAGSLLTMLSNPFSYNVATDPNMQNASNFANQQIASQNAAAGNYGSGNMASSIAQEIAGTLEPTYEGQAYQNWQANNPAMAENIINAFEGNVGGAGQNAATNVGNIYTGTGTNIANLLSGTGNTLASLTAGGTNLTTNTIGNLSNLLGSGLNNYQTQMLLSQIIGNQQNQNAFNVNT